MAKQPARPGNTASRGSCLQCQHLNVIKCGPPNEASDGFLAATYNASYPPDLKPHESLKSLPAYRSIFSSRLTYQLKPSSGNPAPAFTLEGILARFDAEAAAVRLTLECEGMRWIHNGMGTTSDSLGVDPPAPTNTGVFLLKKWGTNTLDKRSKAAQTRRDVKLEARDGYLLNDIPPPGIVRSGNKAVITRTGNVGTIYFFVENYMKDPKLFQNNPEFDPQSFATENPDLSLGNIVTARVYAPDIDGEIAWSAKTVIEIQ